MSCVFCSDYASIQCLSCNKLDSSNNSLDENLKKIFKKMFNIIKEEYPENFFLDKEFYLKYRWSIEEEKEFRNWFINELLNNKEMRKFFGTTKEKNKIKKIVDMFILSYGFRYK